MNHPVYKVPGLNYEETEDRKHIYHGRNTYPIHKYVKQYSIAVGI